LLIYISNCPIDSLYIILLALFNDLTMLPIAYDRQQASKAPEDPDVNKMLYLSGLLGGMATLFTMLFSYGASHIQLFSADYDVNVCAKTAQAGVWLQMSVAAELLIFSARAPSYMWTSIAPSAPLFISVMIGCLVTSIFAADIPYFGSLPIVDIVYIWIYDVFTLVVIDIVKVQYLKMMNESLETLPDTDTREPAIEEAEVAESADVETGHMGRDKIPPPRSRVGSIAEDEDKDEGSDRLSAATSRLNEWATKHSNLSIGFSPDEITGDPTRSMSSSNINVIGARRVSSSAAIIAVKRNHSSTSHISRRVEQEQEARATAAAAVGTTSITVSAAYAARGSSTSLAGVARGTLRPYVPANIRRK
jgi:hypothetical protein